jgi:hypothetical protein
VRLHQRRRAAHHHPRELLLVEPRGVDGLDQLAVAQHRHAIGDLDDLRQVVRDVDDRHALPPQLADDLEQPARLGIRKRGGRLVEQQHARIDRQRLGELDELALGHAQLGHRCRRVDVEAHPLQVLARLRLERLPVDEPTAPAHRPAAHQHVLGDRALRNQAELLVDDPHVPADLDGAGVRLQVARDDLHQRRLAGAVLAQQRVDLPGADLEVDPGERLHARERLRDAGDAEERCHSSQSCLIASQSIGGSCGSG